MQYYAILYYTVLYYIILYYNILYYIILHYIILHYASYHMRLFLNQISPYVQIYKIAPFFSAFFYSSKLSEISLVLKWQ